MPKNKVSDPITDQEIAFAHLVLSGAMTDRQAAEAVGLNPDSAAYTKSKPRVRAYMFEHRAPVEQPLVQKEADGERRPNLDREQVLGRLWEIAHLNPQMTRGSVTGQVKALSMIVAILDLIPDRRAVSSQKKSPPAPRAEIYTSAWRRPQQDTTPATTNDPHPSSAAEAPPNPTELSSRLPRPAVGPERSEVEGPAVTPGPATDPPPNPTELSSRPERSGVEGPAVTLAPSHSTLANHIPPAEASGPYGPGFSFVPDARGPFYLQKNPLTRRR
jgi:hypothetical protein